ncbi:MAG TPA: dicarboxylate/amino acid:cation symporter [Gemmatimonadales bacterium]|jgi:proton glutamate symport protein|nr:dicarboxylate/amino acid:cation symporter [Gemmatimonadales bacterium]
MWAFLRARTLTQWIIVGMVAGTLLGWLAPDAGMAIKPLSTVFLRMIKSIVVPLIFSTLVIGVAGHGDDLRRVGRLALKSILYFEAVTTLALAVGLLAVNVLRPGDGVQLPAAAADVAPAVSGGVTLSGLLEHLVPQSFFEAATNNEVLQIVFWSVLFALALTQVREGPRDLVLRLCEGLVEIMFKFTGIVMTFAPIGIGAAIAYTVGHSGPGVLSSLGKLVLTLYGALVVFAVAVLLPVAYFAGVPVRRFIGAVKEPALIAFSTASSEAALPKAMVQMEAIGVPRRIVAFVIPTGYSFNLDGSTLYLAVAAVFAAQAAGMALTIGQQLVMMLTLMLTSKGVAGVPRAALVILSGTLATFHIPLEAVALILGVDALMDMARTSVNVVGNCLASVVMARWEGEYVETAPSLHGG